MHILRVLDVCARFELVFENLEVDVGVEERECIVALLSILRYLVGLLLVLHQVRILVVAAVVADAELVGRVGAHAPLCHLGRVDRGLDSTLANVLDSDLDEDALARLTLLHRHEQEMKQGVAVDLPVEAQPLVLGAQVRVDFDLDHFLHQLVP